MAWLGGPAESLAIIRVSLQSGGHPFCHSTIIVKACREHKALILNRKNHRPDSAFLHSLSDSRDTPLT